MIVIRIKKRVLPPSVGTVRGDHMEFITHIVGSEGRGVRGGHSRPQRIQNQNNNSIYNNMETPPEIENTIEFIEQPAIIAVPPPPLDVNIDTLFESIKKHKIPQLKQIAQQLHLRVSGTKPILISRIIEYYTKYQCASKIQKIVRGWFVRLWMHGRAIARARNCINDADFYSFEPIDEIPYRFYFTYVSPAAQQRYGFHIKSFIMLVYKNIIDNGSISVLNPYNREPIPEIAVFDAFRFARLYNICVGGGGTADNIFEDDCENMRDIIYCGGGGGGSAAEIQEMILKQSITRKLENIRKKPLEQRVINLFMDIDLLGNYTSHEWFSRLTAHNAVIFWGALYDIWLYRAGILQETKKRICPIHDPFHKKIMRNPRSVEEVLEYCLYAMENLVYMSPDEEYRKLGAMYVLCALTAVSGDARRALPWLTDVVGW